MPPHQTVARDVFLIHCFELSAVAFFPESDFQDKAHMVPFLKNE